MPIEPKQEEWGSKCNNLGVRYHRSCESRDSSAQQSAIDEMATLGADAIPPLIAEVERLRALIIKHGMRPSGTGRQCRACEQTAFRMETIGHWKGCELEDLVK